MTILSHDVLVMDQVTSFMSNDFAIHDQLGHPVGTIHTEGGALSRMVMGSRQLTIHEATGAPLLTVDDVPNFGFDTFDLLGSNGQRFAEVRKNFTLFTKHLSVVLANETLELRGSFWEREFTVESSAGEVARVSRNWPGIGAALLGKERYVLGFAPGSPSDQRAATLGAVIALDLIREKERRASNSSS